MCRNKSSLKTSSEDSNSFIKFNTVNLTLHQPIAAKAAKKYFQLFTTVGSLATHINSKTNKNIGRACAWLMFVFGFILRKFLSFPTLLEQRDYVPLFRNRHFYDWQNVHAKTQFSQIDFGSKSLSDIRSRGKKMLLPPISNQFYVK
uniref:Uncharacterized protein n=1 Tax=Glossina palpalis gambiensis TaxID=67801 RepID=A0A1B0ARN2_9MUSC